MDPVYYKILHVFSLLILTAWTFAAFSNPDPATKRRTMIVTGAAALLLLISGFGLVAKVYGNHFYGWMIVKLVCWLVFSALAGIAYRRPHLRGKLAFIGFTALLIALVMVYVKPF
ncbi:MAG: SirB2 family protein [Opitutaceae bacterium]